MNLDPFFGPAPVIEKPAGKFKFVCKTCDVKWHHSKPKDKCWVCGVQYQGAGCIR